MRLRSPPAPAAACCSASSLARLSCRAFVEPMSAVDESVGVDERSVEKPLEKKSSLRPFPHPSGYPRPGPVIYFQCLVRSTP